MSITAFFRTLASRSHWAIHSVWLVVLAGVLCANVVDGYFQLQENELRLLLSESSIAVNIVKMEVGGITHLLDTVENAVMAQRDEGQLADQLQGLVRDNPLSPPLLSSSTVHHGPPLAQFLLRPQPFSPVPQQRTGFHPYL